MTTFRIEAQVSSDELLRAVSQLNLPDLERFVTEVITLQAQRKAPSITQSEADLLLKINQGIPDTLRERYDDLIRRRKQEALTPAEQIEILRLGEQVEKLETQRIEYLAELARFRKVTLVGLMKNLGIRTPTYA